MTVLGRTLQNHALLDTPLHRVDARAKLLLLPAYALAVVTTPLSPLFVCYILLLALGVIAAQLPLRLLAWRLAILLPFLAVAAVCIPLHPGNGVHWFLNFSVKSILGAGAALLLTASTPFPRLIAALEQLRVPPVLVMIFSFTYRYFFVLAEELSRMIRARDARGYQGFWLGDTRVLGQIIGTLFLRSYERGERVYLAMLSRGFQGIATPAEAAPAWNRRDLLLLGCITLLLFTIRFAARSP